MKKSLLRITSALACLLFTHSAVAAVPLCFDLFDGLKEAQLQAEFEAQENSLSKIKLQQFLESAVQFLQKKVSVSSVRSELAQQHDRKLQLNLG